MNGSSQKHQFVTANGLRLHYLESGDAAQPVLVCLHGLNSNAHAFDEIAPLFAHEYRVIALDLG